MHILSFEDLNDQYKMFIKGHFIYIKKIHRAYNGWPGCKLIVFERSLMYYKFVLLQFVDRIGFKLIV